MRKKLLYLLPLFAIFGSCEKYLDVNKNIDAPAQVEGYLYLANIIQQYQGLYWDIRAIGPMTQMMGTTSGTYTTFANQYYRSEEHTSELQSREKLVCRLLLEK